jgi:hypothetical protein
MIEGEIESKMQELPPELKRELLDYLDFLMQKYKSSEKKAKKFRFDWEGGLSHLKNEFTSVELAHKSLEWR